MGPPSAERIRRPAAGADYGVDIGRATRAVRFISGVGWVVRGPVRALRVGQPDTGRHDERSHVQRLFQKRSSRLQSALLYPRQDYRKAEIPAPQTLAHDAGESSSDNPEVTLEIRLEASSVKTQKGRTVSCFFLLLRVQRVGHTAACGGIRSRGWSAWRQLPGWLYRKPTKSPDSGLHTALGECPLLAVRIQPIWCRFGYCSG